MINDLTETVLTWALEKVLPKGFQILRSDEDEEKLPLPCLLLRVENSEQVIDPASGIYLLEVAASYHSHPKETSREARAEVVHALDQWAFNDPSEALSGYDGFHCYGFQPTTGEVSVDPDRKSFIYTTRWRIWCMPRNNEPV